MVRSELTIKFIRQLGKEEWTIKYCYNANIQQLIVRTLSRILRMSESGKNQIHIANYNSSYLIFTFSCIITLWKEMGVVGGDFLN